jgi:hypothetical protein
MFPSHDLIFFSLSRNPVSRFWEQLSAYCADFVTLSVFFLIIANGNLITLNPKFSFASRVQYWIVGVVDIYLLYATSVPFGKICSLSLFSQ